MGANNKHATLAASAASRWLACPGSIRMCEGLPKTSSIYADEGTAAHTLAEKCLRTLRKAKDYLGQQIEAGDKVKRMFPVTQEMADAVQIYLDTIYAEEKAAGRNAKTAMEQRFNLDHLYPGMFGRNDFVIAEPFGKLTILDYKHGAGVAVDVQDNPQLMYYALGALRQYQDLNCEDVELCIVQPRAIHPDGPVRRCKMPVEDLVRWGNEVLIPGAKATEDPAASLATGDHCRFCPALALCPAQRDQAVAVAKEVFSEVPSAPPAPQALTKPELRRILDASSLIESWLASCREYVKSLLESGQTTSEEIGYKFVAGRASRSWKDEGTAKSFLEMMDVNPYCEPELKSPAQVEKELKGKDAKKALEDLIETTRGKQMVPVSDKREALPLAIEAFGEPENGGEWIKEDEE
jgi:hypothetical protein